MEATSRPWMMKRSPFCNESDGPHDLSVYSRAESSLEFVAEVNSVLEGNLDSPKNRANAALIVEAVNNYDRLRRIERLAGELADMCANTFSTDGMWPKLAKKARELKRELEGK